LLTRLEFASCYVYSNRGTSAAAQRARQLRTQIKRAEPVSLEQCAARVAALSRADPRMGAFFGPDVTLVPAPGSAPRNKDSLWVPERIARALQATGLAGAVDPILERVVAVPESAFAERGQRPSVERHLEAMRVTSLLTTSANLVLVDDVVTKGRTLLAAASCLASAFPHARVRAFALIRYRGFADELASFIEPVVGKIVWDGTDAVREP